MIATQSPKGQLTQKASYYPGKLLNYPAQGNLPSHHTPEIGIDLGVQHQAATQSEPYGNELPRLLGEGELRQSPLPLERQL